MSCGPLALAGAGATAAVTAATGAVMALDRVWNRLGVLAGCRWRRRQTHRPPGHWPWPRPGLARSPCPPPWPVPWRLLPAAGAAWAGGALATTLAAHPARRSPPRACRGRGPASVGVAAGHVLRRRRLHRFNGLTPQGFGGLRMVLACSAAAAARRPPGAAAALWSRARSKTGRAVFGVVGVGRGLVAPLQGGLLGCRQRNARRSRPTCSRPCGRARRLRPSGARAPLAGPAPAGCPRLSGRRYKPGWRPGRAVRALAAAFTVC